LSPRPWREVGGDGVDGGFVAQAVVLAGIDQLALTLSAYHSAQASWLKVSPSTATTCLIGRLYLRAKAKSRSSWAGTAITAPSP
jgi:hypothetical protein